MKYLLTLTILLYCLTSCRNNKPAIVPEELFTSSYRKLDLDTAIRTTVYHKGYYICLLANDKFTVYDTLYQRHKEIEVLLGTPHTNFLYKKGDTTIFATGKKEYYLTDSFTLQLLANRIRYPEPKFYGSLFGEDSVYQVTGCCAGEFGGTVFFYNKKTKKTYWYYAGCVKQVIWFKDAWYVFQDMYSADYMKIKYPDKLLRLEDNNRKKSCNWWTMVDSLNDYDKIQRIRPEGLIKYTGGYDDHVLSSFVYDNNLYSIISNDSSTFIGVHQGDTLKKVQVLLNRNIWFHYTQEYEEAGRKIVSFSGMSGTWNAETKVRTDKTNSGFVIRRGTKIDFLENPTSNTYVDKSDQ